MTDENTTDEPQAAAATAASNETPEDAGSSAAADAASRTAAAAQGSTSQSAGGAEVNLEALLKVPVALSIEVGRKKMRLDDLLETREGSVIELDKLLNEPLDILVNGALIAHGVIVLAQDRFGVQITDILSPEERARTL